MDKMCKTAEARVVASKVWGKIDRQKKLSRGIYEFRGSGHGGIVVDTFERVDILKFFSGKLDPLYGRYLLFEESGLEYVVLYAYFDEIHTVGYYNRFTGVSGRKGYEQWLRERYSVVSRNVEKYYGDFAAYFDNIKSDR